ncbi:MAG: EAL domain-containing protein, partial [Oscillospiraceae bacterium]
FCLMIEYETDQSIIERLETISEKIQDFKKAHHMDFPLNAYFGIYKIKDKTLPAITMSDRALLALQTLSTTGECNYGFYNGSIRKRVLMEKELENDMQSALDNKNFLVFLQPKFSLETSKIVGAESLVRWLHPIRGLIPPSEFITLFEQNGFITKLDYYMFDATCKLIKQWIDDGKKPVPVSVNISRVHLYNPNLAEELYCITLRYNIPTNLIEIELTETMDFENLSILFGIVERLKKFDFTISIDDFGSGYSSLSMLKDLPVDVIKIDREFLSAAADEKRGRKVIESIIDMAKKLDMKTVAEGVENVEQVEFLKSVNCNYVQGYYFSKPIPIKDFETNYIYTPENNLPKNFL